MALQDEWDRREIAVALKVLDSPFRDIASSVVEYVKSARRASPRDVVMVYIPEYVVGRWYEQLLHNQTALRLKSRLFFTPGVMVTSVPWQLRSSQGAEDRLAGSTRRFGRVKGRVVSADERDKGDQRPLAGTEAPPEAASADPVRSGE